VKHLFVGGEAFPVQLARELKSVVASGSVTNMYGPTETTVWSTTWKLEGELDTIPIGTPIANTQIYILDKNLQPLPPGVPGELWIGGDGVVRGYHNRPELTAERFVADPFRNASMSTSTTASFGTPRMYRTGDLAKWRTLPDGSGIIDFLGRVDHQVKIRGYRIELGEIEAQLGRHPQVREMVVVVADEQLVAYVAPKDGPGTAASRVDVASVKDQLRRNLPEFMVPAHIAVLDDLPRTPNGKIDRKALPSLAQVRGASASGAAVEVVPAANDQEREVLTVWKEILGRDGIGVDDNFFDSGGDSLLVVRMHRRLKEVIPKPVSLTDLYRFPTVRSFVEFLSSDGASAAMKQSQDRAARRRENMARRRAR
jgi:acyl-coenzyme A synthetase/AMP-(fatty) acid ligase